MSKYLLPIPSYQDEFVDLCVDLFNDREQTNSFQRFGKNGHRQHGIDIISVEKNIAIQCKWKSIHIDLVKAKNTLLSDIKDDLEKILKKGLSFNKIIFTSTFSNHPEILSWANEKSKELGMTVDFIGWETIESSIQNNSTLLNKYYPVLICKTLKELELMDLYNQYKTNALRILSGINFIGYKMKIPKKPREKEISNLFVQPSFEKFNEYSDININDKPTKSFNFDIPKEYSISDILESKKNAIILGEAGSGKSILTKFIVLKILNEEKHFFKNNEILQYWPIRIELRDYSARKKEKSLDIIDYVSYLFKTEYSLGEIKRELIEKIITTYKCVFFFDGLDEIFDLQERTKIKNDIVNFINPSNNFRVFVTSRTSSYHNCTFDPRGFDEYRIKYFDSGRIKEYVSKWYEIEEENKVKRDDEIEKCFNCVEELKDELKCNPLFLSLAVILFRNDIKLPESKLELYESCTDTLVDLWDKQNKKIEFPNVNKYKKTVFANLAFWQYELLTKADTARIEYRDVYQNIRNFLKTEYLLSDELSDQTASDILEFAESRTIYIENKFTHDTFWEYYTALHIYYYFDQRGNFESRTKIVKKYINNPRWEIVIELLIALIDSSQSGIKIIDELICELLNMPDLKEQHAVLLRASSSIKNISEQTIEKIIKKSIEYTIETAQINTKNYKKSEVFKRVKKVYSELYYYATSPKFYSVFQNVFDTVGLQIDSDETIIKYMIFYYELSFYYDDRIQNTPIKLKRNGLNNYLELNKHLFIIYNLSFWKPANNVFVSKLKTFINKFELNRVDEYLEFVFIYRINLFTYLNIICHEIIGSETLELLINKIKLIDSAGIDIKFILKSDPFILISNIRAKKLIYFIIECDNLEIITLLIHFMKNNDNLKISEIIKPYIIDHPLRKQIQELLREE